MPHRTPRPLSSELLSLLVTRPWDVDLDALSDDPDDDPDDDEVTRPLVCVGIDDMPTAPLRRVSVDERSDAITRPWIDPAAPEGTLRRPRR